FGRQVEARAGAGAVVGDELQARVRPDEARHLRDISRVVEAPHAPLGDREGLGTMGAIERLGRGPFRAVTGLVVEVVADDVDVRVAGEVGGGRVAGDAWRTEALRIPDDAQLRLRRLEVDPDPGEA